MNTEANLRGRVRQLALYISTCALVRVEGVSSQKEAFFWADTHDAFCYDQSHWYQLWMDRMMSRQQVEPTAEEKEEFERMSTEAAPYWSRDSAKTDAHFDTMEELRALPRLFNEIGEDAGSVESDLDDLMKKYAWLHDDALRDENMSMEFTMDVIYRPGLEYDVEVVWQTWEHGQQVGHHTSFAARNLPDLLPQLQRLAV